MLAISYSLPRYIRQLTFLKVIMFSLYLYLILVIISFYFCIDVNSYIYVNIYNEYYSNVEKHSISSLIFKHMHVNYANKEDIFDTYVKCLQGNQENDNDAREMMTIYQNAWFTTKIKYQNFKCFPEYKTLPLIYLGKNKSMINYPVLQPGLYHDYMLASKCSSKLVKLDHKDLIRIVSVQEDHDNVRFNFYNKSYKEITLKIDSDIYMDSTNRHHILLQMIYSRCNVFLYFEENSMKKYVEKHNEDLKEFR